MVDWSGATSNFTLPMARALFVPIQMVFGELKFAKSCCEPSEAACRGAQRACAVDLNLLWGARGSDCCASSTTRSGGGAEWRETRLQLARGDDALGRVVCALPFGRGRPAGDGSHAD